VFYVHICGLQKSLQHPIIMARCFFFGEGREEGGHGHALVSLRYAGIGGESGHACLAAIMSIPRHSQSQTQTRDGSSCHNQSSWPDDSLLRGRKGKRWSWPHLSLDEGRTERGPCPHPRRDSHEFMASPSPSHLRRGKRGPWPYTIPAWRRTLHQ